MNFTVYSKDGCPYCEMVKQVLLGKDLTFTEYKLGVDFDREQFYSEFGQGSTFPQVIMDDTKLGGCTETVKYHREQKII